MKYIAFDIECCDGKHICEFGYVVVDEDFNLLERECITINPQHKFRLTGREKEKDIALAFSEEVYFNSPTFDFYYDRIKSLLTMPDCKIMGFSLKNDVGFLSTACELYCKDLIQFSYLDFQRLYQGYTKSNSRVSIEKIVTELAIKDIHIHKSDDDAFVIIKALQIISEKENLTLSETIALLKKLNNNYFEEKARATRRSLAIKAANGEKKAQNVIIKRFIKQLKVSPNKKDDIFLKKRVCISSLFQRKHFNEFLALIERLYFYGATYTGKVSDCDIFIDIDNANKEDERYICAVRAIEEGHNIHIVSFDEALEALDIKQEDLLKKDYLRNSGSKQKYRTKTSKTIATATIGEILAEKLNIKIK